MTPRIRTAITPPQREESPESQWLFGAVWGAQPQRPPRGIITNQHTITKEAPTQCGASFRISGFRSNSVGIAIKNIQFQSEPAKQDNPMPPRERTNGAPAPRGTETEPPASRPVWRYAANSRRDPNAKRPNRTANACRSRPPRNRNETFRKPSCLAFTSHSRHNPTQSAPIELHRRAGQPPLLLRAHPRFCRS